MRHPSRLYKNFKQNDNGIFVPTNFGFDGQAATGKGTYTAFLGEIFEIPVISFGNALRAMSKYFNENLGINHTNINKDDFAKIDSFVYQGANPIINERLMTLDELESQEVGDMTSQYCNFDPFKTSLVFPILMNLLSEGGNIVEGRNCYHPNASVMMAAKNNPNINTVLTYITCDETIAGHRRWLQEQKKENPKSREECIEDIKKRNINDYNQATPLIRPEHTNQHYHHIIDTTSGGLVENLFKFFQIFQMHGYEPNLNNLEMILKTSKLKREINNSKDIIKYGMVA